MVNRDRTTLPMLLAMLPFYWFKALSAVLLGSGAVQFIIGDPMVAGMTTADSQVVLLVWALAALVAGGWRLLRRPPTADRRPPTADRLTADTTGPVRHGACCCATGPGAGTPSP